MNSDTTDKELLAIMKVIEVCEPLDEEERGRVFDYVFQRLGLRSFSGFQHGRDVEHPGRRDESVEDLRRPPAPFLEPMGIGQARGIVDIRSFKEQKKPGSANEMTALVAYYLSELAPEGERKPEISGDDVDRYFKQAGYPIPAAARHALTNAKNAGYLDSGSERGSYKLNAVGFNLVAHNMPSKESSATKTKKKGSTRKKAKKKASKKKVSKG